MMLDERKEYNHLHMLWDNAHFKGSPTYFVRKALLKKELHKILKNKSYSVFDVGCGTGGYIRVFEKLTEDYVGIDLSDFAISRLKEKYPNFSFYQESIYTFKSKKKFYLVFLSEVLEHLDYEVKALKNIRKILSANGILLLSVPFDDNLWSYSDEIARHRRRYSKDYLRRILLKSGFENIRIYCYGFPLLRCYWIITKRFRRSITNKLSKKNGKKSTLGTLLYSAISKVFLLDTLFLNTNKGIGLIAICKKKHESERISK